MKYAERLLIHILIFMCFTLRKWASDNLKLGWDRPAYLKIGRPILRLSAKLRILKWASDNLKIGQVLSLAPTHSQPADSLPRGGPELRKLDAIVLICLKSATP